MLNKRPFIFYTWDEIHREFGAADGLTHTFCCWHSARMLKRNANHHPHRSYPITPYLNPPSFLPPFVPATMLNSLVPHFPMPTPATPRWQPDDCRRHWNPPNPMVWVLYIFSFFLYSIQLTYSTCKYYLHEYEL